MARRGIPVAIERLVRERASERCEYCRCPEDFSPDTFSIEHIFPRALSGSDEEDNLAFSCQGCNGVKGVRIEAFDEVTAVFVRLFHPRNDNWNEHFRWCADSLQVEGISAIGRATVELLRLNRRGVVNLRRVLMRDGEHPPD